MNVQAVATRGPPCMERRVTGAGSPQLLASLLRDAYQCQLKVPEGGTTAVTTRHRTDATTPKRHLYGDATKAGTLEYVSQVLQQLRL